MAHGPVELKAATPTMMIGKINAIVAQANRRGEHVAELTVWDRGCQALVIFANGHKRY